MNLRQQAPEPCTSVAKKSRTLTSASLARRSCIYPSVVSLPSAPRGLHEAPRLRGPTGWAPKDKGRGRRGSTPRGAPVALPQAKASTRRLRRADDSVRRASNDERGPSTAPHVIPVSAESNKLKAHHRLDWRDVKCDCV